jgi:hypothetical protein
MSLFFFMPRFVCAYHLLSFRYFQSKGISPRNGPLPNDFSTHIGNGSIIACPIEKLTGFPASGALRLCFLPPPVSAEGVRPIA